MNLTSISAFQDNYIWVLSNEYRQCVIVDPGDANVVLQAIQKNNWKPEAILLTHHHADHTGGVTELKNAYPDILVYGPEETLSKGATHCVHDDDTIEVLSQSFRVISTPGHTLGHVCYFSHPYLFCGDTLFSGGCGRLFEGTADQMYHSFQKINALPADTLICCAHEYTLANMEFALSILPENKQINRYYREVKALRSENYSTLPSTLDNERKINVFLLTEDNDLKRKFTKKTQLKQSNNIFAWLREKKDIF